MISDDDLYRLAIFLGSAAMILIVLYHFLEVNTKEDEVVAVTLKEKVPAKPVQSASQSTKQGAVPR
jgi:oligosaccharyl transferase complex subunit OST4